MIEKPKLVKKSIYPTIHEFMKFYYLRIVVNFICLFKNAGIKAIHILDLTRNVFFPLPELLHFSFDILSC